MVTYIKFPVRFLVGEVQQEQNFLQDLRYPQLIVVPRLLHTRLSPPREECDSLDQAPYCTLGPKLWNSSRIRHLAGLGVNVA